MLWIYTSESDGWEIDPSPYLFIGILLAAGSRNRCPERVGLPNLPRRRPQLYLPCRIGLYTHTVDLSSSLHILRRDLTSSGSTVEQIALAAGSPRKPSRRYTYIRNGYSTVYLSRYKSLCLVVQAGIQGARAAGVLPRTDGRYFVYLPMLRDFNGRC